MSGLLCLACVSRQLFSRFNHVAAGISHSFLFKIFNLLIFNVFDCAGPGCTGCSLAVALGLLIAVAYLVVEHGFQGARASVVLARGLSFSVASGIFPDRGSNLCLLH